jgi:hypothetical protein
MSLINDALKQARQAPPRNPQRPLPPLPPAAASEPRNPWLVPGIVIFLIFAAVFFIGWSVAHRSVDNAVKAATAATVATQDGDEIASPVVKNPPPPPLPLPVNPENAPRLQGIFYSATAPAAIVGGKLVRVGDHYLNYRVTEITKYTVTLVGPDGKAIKLSMAN